MLSDHSAGKLQTKEQENLQDYTNTWTLNNTELNDQWVTEEIRKDIKKFQDQMKMKVQLFRGRFLAMRVYVKKKKHFNDSPHLKVIENKINLNPKTADSKKQQRLGQK